MAMACSPGGALVNIGRSGDVGGSAGGCHARPAGATASKGRDTPLPVGERGRRGAEADLDHRADDDVMGRDEAGLDKAAVESDEARLERRRAGREAAPAASRKPRLAGKPRSAGKDVGKRAIRTASVLTQNTPFSASARAESAAASMQTRSEAGLSVTGATAVAVKPARPAGPSVVTTWTEAADPAPCRRGSAAHRRPGRRRRRAAGRGAARCSASRHHGVRQHRRGVRRASSSG